MRWTNRSIRGMTLLLCFVLGLGALATAQELTILTMPHDNNPEKNEARVAAWKAAHPEYADVTVNIVGGWADQVKVMTAGGNPPDVVFYSSSQIPDFVFNGILTSLDGFIQKDAGFDEGTFIPSVVEATSYKQSVYGVPMHWSAVATMYNADLLEQRGLATPDPDWTWEDLVAHGKQTTFDSNGDGHFDHFGFGDHWVHNHRWPYWVQSAGGEFYNEDMTESRLNSPEAIRGIEFMVSLYDDVGIAAKVVGGQLQEPGVTVTASGHGISNDLFGQGRMAFFNTTRFSYPNDAPFRVGILQPPIGPGGRTSVMVTDFYGIHRESEQAELAWSFISFASQVDNALLGFDQGAVIGALSARAPVAIDMLQNAPEITAMNWVTTAEDAVRPSLFHPLGIVSPDWNAIARGEVSVQDAVDEAVRTHNAMLQQQLNDGVRW